MRVEQQKQILDILQQKDAADTKSAAGLVLEKTQAVKSVSGGTTSIQMQDTTYLNPAKEEKKSIVDKIEEGQEMDAFDRKNQMTVLANTTTEEDYKKMQEQGFSLDSTDSHTIITVTDKIKMELAKAGKEVYGDALDAAELEQMTGNAAFAAHLAQVFQSVNLPLTDENLQMGSEAMMQAMSLGSMTDGAIKYMIGNHLEPTIGNLYTAQYSGSGNYKMPDVAEEDLSGLSGQIQNMIRKMGIAVDESVTDDGMWLVKNQIPLTERNLTYYQELKNMQMPMEQMQVANAIVSAVMEGKNPEDAMMIDSYRLEQRAVTAVDVVNRATDADIAYVIDNQLELTVDNLKKAQQNRGESGVGEPDIGEFSVEESGMEEPGIGEPHTGKKQSAKQEPVKQGESSVYTQRGLMLLTAKRQLEEVRLAMSAEANYALLKKGVSIDTEPLVKLVDELKNLETDYYKNLLHAQGVDTSTENVELFAETTEKVQQLAQVPAYVLGVPEADVSTIQGAYEQGTKMQEALRKAGTEYETLMTAPRQDLGDSIQKAFQNVDTILQDLNLETSDSNRRAVRILGYNGIEITEDSVMQMKAADEEVQRMFKNMTPAVVTQLIKNGINPLEMKFTDLNQAIENIQAQNGTKENEKFSEYLYKLEKSNEISSEERSAYIGIYRLIHQVEQTDGAAIGALVNQGADITMKNLLTAVRSSRKAKQMDISVDDSYGDTEKVTKFANSITDQIETAYHTNCIKDASEVISPERLRQVITQNENWQELSPEQFARALEQAAEQTGDTEEVYAKEQLAMLQKAAASPEEVYQILQQFDLPNTALNVTAISSMMTNRNQLFRQLFGEESTNPNRKEKITAEDIETIKEDIIEDFGEAVSEPEALAKVQETLGKVAENVMKTMIESENVTSIDIREMRLMQAKLSINQEFSKKEQYSIPVLIGDKVTNVSLKIVRGVDTRGIVDVMLESEMAGKIAATFQAKEEGVSALVVTDNMQTRELLAENGGQLADAIQEKDGENFDLRVVFEKNLDLNHFSGAVTANSGKNLKRAEAQQEEKTQDAGETDSPVYKVQTARLYHIAESFLKTIKEWA